MKARTNADQSIQYPRPQRKEIKKNTEVDLFYNSGGNGGGIWHVFTQKHGNTQCLCGHKTRREHTGDNWKKTRTVKDILENPSKGFGHVSRHAVNYLEKQVKQSK